MSPRRSKSMMYTSDDTKGGAMMESMSAPKTRRSPGSRVWVRFRLPAGNRAAPEDVLHGGAVVRPAERQHVPGGPERLVGYGQPGKMHLFT